MHSIKNRGAGKDDYVSSMSSVDAGTISIISNSSNSQRFSDLTSSAISNNNVDSLQNDFGQFDIIDDLDYDDIDDGLIGKIIFFMCYCVIYRMFNTLLLLLLK
jgi:hypothetical protein